MTGQASSWLPDNFPTACPRRRNPDACYVTTVRSQVVADSEALLNGQRTLSRFAWSERAKNAEGARRAVDTSPRAPELVERFYNAVEAAYPPDFWEHYERLKNGDARGVEMAIEFLEADPWFFRSGYIKANLARFLKRVPLSNQQVRRLEKVLLKIVDERNTQEFRNYCRLGATWMLFAIEQDYMSRNR